MCGAFTPSGQGQHHHELCLSVSPPPRPRESTVGQQSLLVSARIACGVRTWYQRMDGPAASGPRLGSHLSAKTVEEGDDSYHCRLERLEGQRAHSGAVTCFDVLPYAPWKATPCLTSLTASWLLSWSRPKTTSS